MKTPVRCTTVSIAVIGAVTLFCVATPLSTYAKFRLYSRTKADSLRIADSLKHTDERWISDSTLRASYLKPEKKKTSRFRLYSRDRDEEHTTDSLQQLDSIRVADSIRIADSLLVARYQKADVKLIDRQKAARIEAENNQQIVGPIRPSSSSRPAYNDNLSARSITIAPDNPFAGRIDSLQAVIDHVNDSIHDNDRYFKKMKIVPVSEKKRYIDYLLKNHFKDSAQVLTYCNNVYNLYNLKNELLVAIRNSQDVNTKSFISYHIEEHRRKTGEMSELLLSLTPTVPFQPEHRAAAAKE